GYSQGIVVVDYHFELDFREEVDLVLGAAVDLGLAALAAEALDFGDGHSLDADRLECVLDVFELEWLDDRSDEFHELSAPPLDMVAGTSSAPSVTCPGVLWCITKSG